VIAIAVVVFVVGFPDCRAVPMIPQEPELEQAASPVEVETTRELFAAVYAKLKAMAANQLARGFAASTLETTGLVHDLYLRLDKHPELRFAHRAQFFAYAARAMRHLLADRARDRRRQRAGGEWVRVTMTGDNEQFALESAEAALQLVDVLERLQQLDARAAQVLELRYFAGLTIEQIADTLGSSPRTVDRDWLFARAFVKAELG
jgi:RNA polymerase sigma factor (TIGR02999 family)